MGGETMVESLAPMSIPRELAAAVTGDDGRMRVFGGLGFFGVESSQEAYDPVTNTWATGEAGAQARYGHAAVTDASGRALVLGGTPDGVSPTASVEAYMPSTGDGRRSDLPTARLGLAAARAPDGRIFVIGGRGLNGQPSNLVEILSEDGATWTAGPGMPTARLSLQVVAAPNGRIYAIGGRNAENLALNVVESLDPASGIWQSEPSLAVPRYWFAAALGSGGRIVVAGGVGNLGFLDSAESLSEGEGAWSQLASMPEARGWVTAAAVPDGRILLAGGSPARGSPAARYTLAYDPTSDSWSY
jgi:N-acetylneuraminic acid mutarotase